MKADYVIGELAHLQHTLRQLNDPYILSAEVNSDGDARIHLYAPTMDDALKAIGEMGDGMYHVDQDLFKEYDRYSDVDLNGVEVYWLIQKKTAPDEATSEAAVEEKNDCCGPSRASSINAEGPEVKEAEGK